MINLYNFMDGIDGLAASEGVVVAGAAGILLILGGATGIAAVAVVLAGCCAGFLVWNWPPARIFMGDVSSGFLGFVFAVLAIWTSNNGILELQVWAVLLGVFLIDATLTMARRMAAGEKWYTAHRSHAYQRAVTAGHSHLSVTLTVIAIDLALVAAAATMVFVPSARGYVLATTLGGLAVAWIAIVRRWPAAQRPNPIAR
jgi:Fuc2NAc and GlcNAc transferase